MSLSTKTYEDVFLEEAEREFSDDLAIDSVLGKLFAKIESSADDEVVELLRNSCQRAFEEFTKSCLFETTVTALFSAKSGNIRFQVPYKPITSITHIRTGEDELTSDDNLDSDDYSKKGNWITIDNFDGELVEVKYISKMYDSAENVDSLIKEGLLIYLNSNYEDRDDISAIALYDVPNGSKSKWMPFKNVRF